MSPKTLREIEILAEGGHILASIMKELVSFCQVGTRAEELDKKAEELIRQAGGEPSFKNFGPLGNEFPASLCVSPNEMVVHGIPHQDLVFKEGDVVGLDLGLKYKGLFTDHAVTIVIGKGSQEAEELIAATKECLRLGIEAARLGNHIGDIGAAVQKYAEGLGYGVVRTLTGHEVGYAVHEDLRVPNFGQPGQGEKLVEGLVIAIEPMINMGSHEIKTADDGWGIITADKKLSAHFEHTMAITKDGPRILTL